jgi:translocation and assembly module TamB
MAPQPIAFHLNGDLPTITFFRAVTARFDSLAGRLTFDLAASGTVGAPKAQGMVRLTNLGARLPTGGLITGGLEGDFSYTVARDSAISAAFRLTPRSMALAFGPPAGHQRLTLADTGIVVRIGADGVHGGLELRLADATAKQIGTISGNLGMPRYTRLGAVLDSQPVTATLAGRIDDLAFIRAFSPQIDSLRGQIVLDTRVSGTVAKPLVAGGGRLDAPMARLALLGVTYRDIKFAATADSAGTFALQGGVKSGPGSLNLTGRSPLRPTARRPAHLQVRGDNFEAINVPEVHAIVSPAIDVVVAGDSIDARGDVQLPYVRVELADIPERAVPPTDDVVYVDTLAVDTTKAWRITSHIRVALGDSVTFKGFNFDAQFGGQLVLIQEPGREPVGSGTILIEQGRYKAYGQDLTIENGQIRFAGGPVTDPSLAIRAVRVATDSTTAGLDIAGTLKHPQVTIFSNPSMSESSALAYIITGKPPGETSGASGDLLSKAATSLGLSAGSLLARSIGSNLGLSDVRVESAGDVQRAALVAGKYLAPNLYVSYGIGLFSPISILRLRYDLTSRISVQAERGAATGADIFFRTERGRSTTQGIGTADTGTIKP